MLEINNLTVKYGSVVALENVSLTLGEKNTSTNAQAAQRSTND